jgi:hypothetical protein
MGKRDGRAVVRKTSLSRSRNLDELADYWDTHDLGDVWNQTREVKADIRLTRRRYLVTIESDIIQSVRRLARRRRVSCGLLINRLLRERLAS